MVFGCCCSIACWGLPKVNRHLMLGGLELNTNGNHVLPEGWYQPLVARHLVTHFAELTMHDFRYTVSSHRGRTCRPWIF